MEAPDAVRQNKQAQGYIAGGSGIQGAEAQVVQHGGQTIRMLEAQDWPTKRG